MKYPQMALSAHIFLVPLMFVNIDSYSQKSVLEYGKAVILKDITPTTQEKNTP